MYGADNSSQTASQQLPQVKFLRHTSLPRESLPLAIAPDACDLRCCDDECLLGWADSIDEANINACWAINHDVVVAQ